MGDDRPSRGQIGFAGMLQLLFIAFKLLGIINWTWFWVLSPIWIEVCIVLVALLVISIKAVVEDVYKKK